ncbi:unnamed protein product [Peronospora farinosa]|uniref:Uncharacterized protein n=1 Tax=Peronospora farinosa TaxID=134698 RepID=A0AAV0STU2_9STRA|nr:unnamed protein product [Peronospora farinosa]CAI5708168.1 unnamed protein product [Peronospora farinosa]
MKLFTVFTSVIVAVTCLLQPSVAQTTIHLRVHTVKTSNTCYLQCDSGKYCPNGASSCQAPPAGQCFNPAQGVFQTKCDAGFKCDNGKCVAELPICYLKCDSGKYCPRGASSCQAPPTGQCFNPAQSVFQNGCDAGFKCDNGNCVHS